MSTVETEHGVHTHTGTALLGKLHKIMADIPRIAKDGTNPDKHYDYATEKLIKETVRAKLIEHGVQFTLEVFSVERLEIQQDRVIVIANCRYHFWDVESGERLSGNFVGSGQGRDEKGVYSAITGAIKYALTAVCLIPTGDDAEATEPGQKSTKPLVLGGGKGKGKRTPVAPPKTTPPVNKSKPKSGAKKPVAKKPAAKAKPEPAAEAPLYLFGMPDENEKRITPTLANNILAAYGSLEAAGEENGLKLKSLTQSELEALAGFPILQWTTNMKPPALELYTALKNGTTTLEEAIAASQK